MSTRSKNTNTATKVFSAGILLYLDVDHGEKIWAILRQRLNY